MLFEDDIKRKIAIMFLEIHLHHTKLKVTLNCSTNTQILT